jgi:hypothetical protein
MRSLNVVRVDVAGTGAGAGALRGSWEAEIACVSMSSSALSAAGSSKKSSSYGSESAIAAAADVVSMTSERGRKKMRERYTVDATDLDMKRRQRG